MTNYEQRQAEIAEAIAKYQTPYQRDIFRIIGAAMQTGKIDDLLESNGVGAEGTKEQDLKHATDFVLQLPKLTVGFRVRTPINFVKYRHDVTIRCREISAVDDNVIHVDYSSEFEKLLNGIHPHLNIYGFLDPDRKLMHWMVYRPDVIRKRIREQASVAEDFGKKRVRWPMWLDGPIPNFDGTYFRALKLASREFPREAVIANSGYVDKIFNPEPYPWQSLNGGKEFDWWTELEAVAR